MQPLFDFIIANSPQNKQFKEKIEKSPQKKLTPPVVFGSFFFLENFATTQ
jgi:hypothetical protein